ncbi:MAG: hypothetical protein PVI00_16790 [Desulfobacterales bacterium]
MNSFYFGRTDSRLAAFKGRSPGLSAVRSIDPPLLSVRHKDFPIIADIKIMQPGDCFGRKSKIIEPDRGRMF